MLDFVAKISGIAMLGWALYEQYSENKREKQEVAYLSDQIIKERENLREVLSQRDEFLDKHLGMRKTLKELETLMDLQFYKERCALLENQLIGYMQHSVTLTDYEQEDDEEESEEDLTQ